MSNYKDMCNVDRMLPIHQLNKINDKGTKRDDFFPLSVIQAIFDKTGIRLDTIISSFNYIFLPYKGTKEDTRLQVVGLMRRKSLVICYRDLDDNITIEMYVGTDRNDDAWKDNINWKNFVDFITDSIKEILSNLNDYPEIVTAIQEACKSLIESWLNENSESIINNYLDLHWQDTFNDWIQNNAEQYFNDFFNRVGKEAIENWLINNANNTITNWLNDNTSIITDYIDTYLNEDNFNQLVQNKAESIINNYLDENLQPIVDKYFENIQTYVANNERVVANALSRHEEDLLNLKSK